MGGMRGQRLEPHEMTRHIEAPKLAALGARLAAATLSILASVMVVIFASALLQFPQWLAFSLLAIAAPVGYLSFRYLNVERFLWLESELIDEPGALPYSSTINLSGEHRIVSAAQVEVGDFICATAEIGDSNIAAAGHSPSPTSLEQHKRYHRVIAKVRMNNSRRITIITLGREHPYVEDPDDENFYLVRAQPQPSKLARTTISPENVAKALTDLINLVPSDQSPISECSVSSRLINDFGNAPEYTRLAVGIAKSGGLIRRRRRISYLLEAIAVYSKSTRSGHSSCMIYATESGLIWKCAAHIEPDYINLNEGARGMGDTFINHGVAGSMGHDNTVANEITNPKWKSEHNPDIEMLARQLQTLRTALNTATDTDPDQDVAIAQVASAQVAAQKGDFPGMMARLGQIGPAAKWVLDIARSIGISLAIASIKESLHIH
jgi:hypothetical protein